MECQNWIKFWRKVKDNKIFLHDPNAWHIFEYLLMTVNYTTGQWDTGRFVIANALFMNPNTVYASLKRLEKAKMITQVSNNKYSTISICKWKEYQGGDNNNDNNKITSRQQQDNTNKELKNNNKEEYIRTFELFWKEYPNKSAKKKALESWLKIKPESELAEVIILAVERHKTIPSWKKDNGEYIPHATTWLNQERWNDEIESKKSLLSSYK